MHRILLLPDIRPAGYPVNPKAGYRISGQISGKGRIPDIRPDTVPVLDIRPDTWLDNYIFGQISNKFIKTAFNNHRLLQTLNKKYFLFHTAWIRIHKVIEIGFITLGTVLSIHMCYPTHH
jgi:hypothetical protein